MRSKKPIADKDLKTYPVEDYPFMLTKKYGKPRYFRTFADARQVMVDDLKGLQYSLGDRLGDKNAARAISQALRDVESLPPRGGKVSSLVDPYTGIRYQAWLVDRRAPE